MNPYDPCVWNAVVKGKQITIMHHIDDLLMSHVNARVVTEFIAKLEREYGKRDPLTVLRGKVHEYLGMTIDFRTGDCVMSQFDFLKKMWSDLPENLKGAHRNTPAPESLFKIDLDSPVLDDERKEQCHHVTAKSLWLSQRSRPDIQLATHQMVASHNGTLLSPLSPD